MRELAGIALDAALTLDQWSLSENDPTKGVRRFAGVLGSLCTESDDAMLLALHAYHSWKPSEVVATIADITQKIRTVSELLTAACETGSGTSFDELASLRDFCVKFSRKALECI